MSDRFPMEGADVRPDGPEDAARDRVLDYALGRTLGAEPETDLSERILQAWSRGVPGSLDVDEVDLTAAPLTLVPPAGAPRNGVAKQGAPSRRFPWAPLLAAAAAVLVVFAFVLTMSRGPTAAASFASASSEVALLSPGDRALHTGLEVQPGEVVLVEGAPVEFRTAAGTTLRAESGTVLLATERDGAPAFELEQGALAVVAGAEPFWITAQFASLRALPGAELTARVDVELSWDPAGEESLRDRALSLLAPDSMHRRSLVMDVSVGAAEFEHDGVLLTVVPTRGPRTLSGPVLLAESDIERFDTLFQELCSLREAGLYESKALLVRLKTLEELSTVLGRSVPLWSRLRRGVEERRADPAVSDEFLGNVIDFLHTDPSVEGLAYASDLWLEVPEWFNERHLVTFAERGAFEFQREIEAMVEMYDPLDLQGAEPGVGAALGEGPPVLASAYLAVRGDERGRLLLEQVGRGVRSKEWVAPWGMLAALALDALGDPVAWEELELFVQDVIIAALEANELIAASRILLQFEYFDGLREGLETPILGTVQRDASRWVDLRSNEVQSEVDILDVMEELFD